MREDDRECRHGRRQRSAGARPRRSTRGGRGVAAGRGRACRSVPRLVLSEVERRSSSTCPELSGGAFESSSSRSAMRSRRFWVSRMLAAAFPKPGIVEYFVSASRKRLGRSRKIVALLRQPVERLRRPRQRLAARAVAVRQLRRLPLARMVAVLLRLRERVAAAVHVLEPVDERPGEAEERIRPVGTQRRRFAERDDRFGEFLLRLRVLSRALLASPLMRCRWPSQ